MKICFETASQPDVIGEDFFYQRIYKPENVRNYYTTLTRGRGKYQDNLANDSCFRILGLLYFFHFPLRFKDFVEKGRLSPRTVDKNLKRLTKQKVIKKTSWSYLEEPVEVGRLGVVGRLEIKRDIPRFYSTTHVKPKNMARIQAILLENEKPVLSREQIHSLQKRTGRITKKYPGYELNRAEYYKWISSSWNKSDTNGT